MTRRIATSPAPHRRYLPLPRPSAVRARLANGLYPGEPEACRRDWRQFAAIFAHLALLVAVARVYRLEGRAFEIITALTLAAVPIHYLLPYRWKKQAAAATGAAALLAVFGWQVGLIVLGISTLLVGVLVAPMRWGVKVGMIAAAGIALAACRAWPPWPSAYDPVIPLVATMFMFRVILYLYEQKHAKAPETVVDTAGYFLLAPNFCFLHFPVVDYRAFRRGYLSTDVHTIQRTGLQMIFRGMIHLLAYRLVYHELLIAPEAVVDLASLGRYLVCNYLLYLRVSGQFHVACGMLHLFGYQLPETHHHYLLADSFTDYWRRINIYWKDFMVRVFFNPTVFRLKRWPQPAALAAATCVVFLATWVLHAYQSFWLRGTWGFSVPDALFWGILGLLVLVNVQLDARRSRTRRPAAGATAGPAALALRGLKIAATFTTIAVLWSLWSSPTLGAWVDMMRRAVS